jgi:hypothetical protein
MRTLSTVRSSITSNLPLWAATGARAIASMAMISWLLPLASGQQKIPAIEQIASELQEVRAELTHVRLDLESARADRLKQEHAAAAKNRQRLEGRERSSYEAIASLDRQLSSSGLTPEERMELELLRKEALDVSARTKQQFLEADQKESEIAKQLREAHRNVAILLDRSKQRKP